jgi:hypothetical protein
MFKYTTEMPGMRTENSQNTPVYLFEGFGSSTYGKALAYHQTILSRIPKPYSKAVQLGSYFPEWFSLYVFMLHIEKTIEPYFNKPHYQLLTGEWQIYTLPGQKPLSAAWRYTPIHPEWPDDTSGTRRDGYLIHFSGNPNNFMVFDGKDDWEDVKTEATRIFRPVVELRAPTPKAPGNSVQAPLR